MVIFFRSRDCRMQVQASELDVRDGHSIFTYDVGLIVPVQQNLDTSISGRNELE